ncbi:MAG: 50S ribosomal protein L25 [Candidatus Omnitrophica bacterium CG11_big_fil_rev_8_21_14_0_20_42_13]|uniref:Large ribosomal subunit protein bL25 n=1 Tax=Candidatus Ghiorseimicrobium undicola TaxID=1974746 RepID=A0A2H0LZG1_9BACT|nr:MAG: 50S ribosomal protein L25 [Candidatus Omnitrophica bacterium CG11_big_fil_rev_8_21_14_0_20_42_13]
MEEIILMVGKRTEIGTKEANQLRKSGFIPGVVYGEAKSEAIKISRSILLKFLHEHKGENLIINLKIDEGDAKKAKSSTVMIKEIQLDPVSDEIIHIDFNRISMTKAITVKVPVEAKGESIGVKADGGALEHILWELEIECLPKDIPNSITIDVSQLKIGDAIHIKDIKFPEGLKVKHELNAIVLSIAPPAREEVPAAGAEVLAGEGEAEPEVIKEKKKEEAAKEPKEAVKEPKETKESK